MQTSASKGSIRVKWSTYIAFHSPIYTSIHTRMTAATMKGPRWSPGATWGQQPRRNGSNPWPGRVSDRLIYQDVGELNDAKEWMRRGKDL